MTPADAIGAFTRHGLWGNLRRAWRGPLRVASDVYLPFRLYPVSIANGRGSQTRLFAMDAVEGTLDLYAFETAPSAADLLPITTRNRVDTQLRDDQCREILASKVRRLLFSGGFFRLADLGIRLEPACMEFHIPYWVGFFGPEHDLRISVIDAVRRRIEGRKVVDLLGRWLLPGNR